MSSIPSPSALTAVCIDLDGTLLRTDVLSEALLLFIRRTPWKMGLLLYWLLKGRAVLKNELAKRIPLKIELMPVNQQIVTQILFYKALGHPLYLVTAAPEAYAQACAHRFGFFDGVMASPREINLRSHQKAHALVERFGEKGYIYAGNSRHDIPVWRHAAANIAINTPRSVLQKIKNFPQPLTILQEKECQGSDFVKGIFSYFNLKLFPIGLWSLGLPLCFVPQNFKLNFLGIASAFGGFLLVRDLVRLEWLRLHEQDNIIATGALPNGKTLRWAMMMGILGLCLQFL